MKTEIKNKKTWSKKRIGEWIFCYSFLFYPILLTLVFYVYANLSSFVLAFQNVNLDGTRSFAGLENFKSFISQLMASEGGLIQISFINSIIKYMVGMVIIMPLQIIFSYMIFKKCFANELIRILVMLPSIISGFVFSMVFRNFAGVELQKFMQSLGFENFPNLLDNAKYVFGTTVFYTSWISFSSALILYPNAMRSIDPAIIESAQIDGMSTMWQELRHIILPLIFPTMQTFIVVGFSAIMSDPGPLVEFYMYSAPAEAWNMGYYITVQIFNDATPARYPMVSAGGMILTLIVAPLTMLHRYVLNKIDPLQEN